MNTRLPKLLDQLGEAGDGLTDGQLLARFVAARDEASFATLLRRHGPMVLGVCRRVLRDAHDADDAFQATFLILARKAAAVVKRDSVGSYLYAVAYHTALEAAHANARRRAREKPMNDLPHPEAPRVDPAAAATDWRPLLDRELNRLPEKCRAALVLCDLEGVPQRRAALNLGVPLSTLSSRLTRARALLAKRLTARGLTLSAGALAVALAAESASAQVPALLEGSTARVALLIAAGHLAAVPTPAAALMKGVMKAMLMRKLRLVVAALMVVMVLGAVGFACRPATEAVAQDKPKGGGKDADQAPRVQVSKPISRALAEVQDFVGRTEATETVDLRCRLSGPLTKVACKQGASVKKGDLLFEVDPRPYEIDMEKAAAEVLRAEATRKKAAADLERAEKLMEAKTISREEIDHFRSDIHVADAALKVAQASLSRAKLELDYTRVAAPINGTVVKAPLTVGNYVNAGTTTLGTIASTDPMAVAFEIDERTYLSLQESARAGKIKSIRDGKNPVKMRLSNDEEFKYEGAIDSVDPQANSETGTVRVRAIFPNADGKLIPGLFARVRLAKGEAHQVLLVDPEAVLEDKEGKYLLIVTDKNVVARRPVTLGPQSDGLQVVKTGLEAGDLVVVPSPAPKRDTIIAGPPRNLAPGTTVRPEVVVMPGQPDKKAKPGDK
jgi:RND family efflux transporter MFP subunit